MASTGSDNWNRNWKGGDYQSTVKKSSVSFYRKSQNGSFVKVGNLSEGTPVTYIDSQTNSHTRSAIRLSNSDEIYYINIDNLVKPQKTSRAGISLNPSSFGLQNTTYTSVSTYHNSIVNALNGRDDIDGELFDYLYQLLNYVMTGVHDYDGIKMTGFPWGAIQKDFGEVLGPIDCIKRNKLSGIVSPTGLSSAKIQLPMAGQSLYDYKIIAGTNEYLISAKSGKGVSNQVKPQFVIPVVLDNLSATLLRSNAYKLLKILADYSIKQGAFYGWKLLQVTNDLTDNAISDIELNYAPRNKRSTDKVVDYESWKPFLRKYFGGRKNITYGQLRHKCETLIENASKTGTLNSNLKTIFNIFLNESRIIYVKMVVDPRTGKPSFSADAGGGSTLIRRLYLRTSNDSASRTSDRIGFQVS